MSWKMKQWFRKAMPLLVLGLVLYSGYSLYRHGLFRRGFGPAISSTLGHIPVLGSHFRHFGGSSYSYSAPSYAYHPRPRYHGQGFGRHHRRHGHRRHHGGHHRRHRRHH